MARALMIDVWQVSIVHNRPDAAPHNSWHGPSALCARVTTRSPRQLTCSAFSFYLSWRHPCNPFWKAVIYLYTSAADEDIYSNFRRSLPMLICARYAGLWNEGPLPAMQRTRRCLCPAVPPALRIYLQLAQLLLQNPCIAINMHNHKRASYIEAICETSLPS